MSSILLHHIFFLYFYRSAAVATDSIFGCPSSKYGSTTTCYTHIVKPDGGKLILQKYLDIWIQALTHDMDT